MNKKLLLSVLAGCLMTLAQTTQVFAADSAPQTVTAQLGILKSVVGKGTGLGGTINPDTGVLSSLAPSFTVTTNYANSQILYMTATAPYGGTNPEQAFTKYTGHQGTYIVLANVSVGAQATQGAIQDITGGTLAGNANAIAYPFTPQPTAGALTNQGFNSPQGAWAYTLAQAGDTSVDNGISGSPLASTYTTVDQPGNYQATVTLAFAP